MRGTSKMLSRIICQTIQWDFNYMTNLKNTFLSGFLKDFHEFGVISSKLFQVKRELKQQDTF